MKKFYVVSISLALMFTTSLVIGKNTRFSDPGTVVTDQFWGNLYAEGGNSFFCIAISSAGANTTG